MAAKDILKTISDAKMPAPLLVVAAAAAGAAIGYKALKREWARVNSRLDEAEKVEAETNKANRPTLKKDKASGEWRPG
ncbi:hypothetical protein [Methylopila sp. M107]|uniref:hypothetical protein n=1 Tax=Methylopila sp. M107 TaxID=1101190 RepID=UPI00036592C5|nr:hypothetical protein [Methylopila sp. M107]